MRVRVRECNKLLGQINLNSFIYLFTPFVTLESDNVGKRTPKQQFDKGGRFFNNFDQTGFTGPARTKKTVP